MDKQLFIIINSWAGQWQVIDLLVYFFGKYFLYVFAATIAVLWVQKEWRTRVYLAFGAALINRGLIVEILKNLFYRPRPYEVINVHQIVPDHELSVSFPSGHATIFFSFAFAFYGTKYFWPFFILACIGSFARVIAGLHYPSDILAGAILGGLLTLLFRRLLKTKF